MGARSNLKVEELVDLARDKSESGRSVLVAAIGGLYADPKRKLTDHDRAVMAEVLGKLINEVETSVRQALAHRFAELPNAPSELIVALANDEIDVARPVLAKSEVLGDAELLEIIEYRAMEHHLAIAVRRTVSESVSNALVETDNEVVVTKLLRNHGAQFSDGTMNGLVARSRTVPGFQMPLADRNDLSPELAKKLFQSVSAAVRDHILERFDLDPKDVDDTIAAAAIDAVQGSVSAGPAVGPGQHSEVGNTEVGQVLVTLLRQGDIARFLNAFARLADLSVQQARQILFETGGENLAVTCRAMSLVTADFVQIFLWFRQGRLGDKQVEKSELSRAIRSFEDTSTEAAAKTLQAWKSGKTK